MKKLIVIIGMIVGLHDAKAVTNAWASGVDFTVRSNVTAALIYQAVNQSRPTNNHGLVILSYTAPSVATYGSYSNYLWLDVNYTPPILKTWSGGVTNWVVATIPANSIETANIVNGAVTQAKLATNAVATVNLQDNSVSDTKILAQAVTTGKIAVSGVNSSNIADSAVITSKIASLAVVTTNIADGAVTPSKLSAPITQTNIAANSINVTNMQINSIVTSNITVNAVVNTNVLDSTLTTNKFSFYMQSYTNMVTNAIPAAGASVSFTHGLAGVPSKVRVVLVCNNAAGDAGSGAVLGDEIDIFSARPNATSEPLLAIFTSSTAVTVVRGDAAGTWRIAKKSTGVLTAVTSEANFVLRVRAWFQP